MRPAPRTRPAQRLPDLAGQPPDRQRGRRPVEASAGNLLGHKERGQQEQRINLQQESQGQSYISQRPAAVLGSDQAKQSQAGGHQIEAALGGSPGPNNQVERTGQAGSARPIALQQPVDQHHSQRHQQRERDLIIDQRHDQGWREKRQSQRGVLKRQDMERRDIAARDAKLIKKRTLVLRQQVYALAALPESQGIALIASGIRMDPENLPGSATEEQHNRSQSRESGQQPASGEQHIPKREEQARALAYCWPGGSALLLILSGRYLFS